MQFLRNLSKSKTVVFLTAAFAILMVGIGLEKGLFEEVRSNDQRTEKIQYKLKNIVMNHISTQGREPDQVELESYTRNAKELVHFEEEIKKFFKAEGFRISTKELLRTIHSNKAFKPILAKLKDPDRSQRKEIPLMIEEIKNLAEQEFFQSILTDGVLIDHKDNENFRKAYMQRKAFEWLKIGQDYLDNVTLGAVSEAEVQSIYAMGSFATEPTARIAYIRIRADDFRAPTISHEEVKSKMISDVIPTQKSFLYHMTEYSMSDTREKKSLPYEFVKKNIQNSDQLSGVEKDGKLYYSSTKGVIMTHKQAIDNNINGLKEGQFFLQSGDKKLFRIDQIEDKKCLTDTCIQHAMAKLNKAALAADLNERASVIEKEKLFQPKDLAAIARKTKYKLHRTEKFTPGSDIRLTLESEKLKNHVFEKFDKNGVSESLRLENGDIVFYQIEERTHPTKKPIEEVQAEIVSQLQAKQKRAIFTEDIKAAVKHLNNGNPVEELEEKFKVRRSTSESTEKMREEIPYAIAVEAENISSVEVGWSKPLLRYDYDSGHYYLLSLKSVTYTDKSTTPIENILTDERVRQVVLSNLINIVYQDILSYYE